MFEHDGKNARTNNPDKVFGGQTMAGRVTVEPLRNARTPSAICRSASRFTRSDVPEGISGAARPDRARAELLLRRPTTSSTARAAALGIEMQFRPGPASIKAEWMRVETERRGESVEDTDLSPIVGEGWYVSGTVRDHRREEVERRPAEEAAASRAASARSKSPRASRA